MKKYQYNQQFFIKYCDANFKDEMKISTALSFMEEAASWSAQELGFGYDYIKAKGQAFIISNSCIEFSRPVLVREKPIVQTWPNQPSFVILERQYNFLSEQEEVARAATRWCIIDIKTDKILPSKSIDNQDFSTYRTDKVLTDIQWKIAPFAIEEENPRFCITIANSEYDHNMHVNNTKYADYCMNVFSVQELQNKWVRRFSIAYIKQCKEGETLRFFRKETSKGEFLVQAINDNNEPVVRAEICLAEY